MQMHKLRRHTARAAAVAFAGLTAAVVVGAGVASAATPPDPAGGSTPVAPHFYNGNVEGIRDTGSDTTFFMMQRIGDLYTGAGLYGCTLNSSAGGTMFNSLDTSTVSNESYYCVSGGNVSTTDINDNWDRTEVTEGVDSVGSGAGQNQLCGAASTPLPVDFSRSSKPAGTACSTLVQTGYAKDGVPIIDYPINPSIYGTSTTAPYSNINGGVFGPVSSGWLPGNSPSGPFTGTKLTDIDNDDGTGGGLNSTAYRIWCALGGNQITDWGQLTNLGPSLLEEGVTTTSGSTSISITGTFPSTVASGDAVTGTGIPASTTLASVSGGTATLSNAATASGTPNLTITTASALAVGQGVPIGITLRVMGVNTASGTEATYASYAESGVASGGCSSNMDTDAGTDPNPVTDTGTNTSQHIALENNSDQLDQFAIGDFPSPDYVDQAIEVSTSLYIESNGVFNTNPYAAASTIDGTSYSGNKLKEDGVAASASTELGNSFPTARTLFNIYRTDTIRASVGGFLNWICDGNTNFSKGLDNTTGVSFDTELTNLIGTVFGFPRLTDTTPAVSPGTPLDGIAAPNNSCAASLSVNTTSGSDTVTLSGGGNFAPDIVNAGGLVGGGSVGVTGTGIPASTTVASGGGSSTLTLSAAATATGTTTVSFSGVPAVTSVSSGGAQS
jgi:hypothetical protein